MVKKSNWPHFKDILILFSQFPLNKHRVITYSYFVVESFQTMLCLSLGIEGCVNKDLGNQILYSMWK